jgi:hypothetical protein
MSILAQLYPHQAPGLCGALHCQAHCAKHARCPAAIRRRHAQHTRDLWRQFTVKVDRRRLDLCTRIHDAGLCKVVCREVGGCFLPKVGDHPSEAIRKVHRAQLAADALVRYRSKSKEVNK